MLTKKDYMYLNMAKRVAKLSDYNHFHHGCILIYKGNVIGKGYNSYKSHPVQKRYNRKYRDFDETNNYIVDSVHAEIAAIASVGKWFNDWNKVKAYIYRIRDCGDKGMSRPCPACMNALKDVGIKDIYYTTKDGYCYERID